MRLSYAMFRQVKRGEWAALAGVLAGLAVDSCGVAAKSQPEGAFLGRLVVGFEALLSQAWLAVILGLAAAFGVSAVYGALAGPKGAVSANPQVGRFQRGLGFTLAMSVWSALVYAAILIAGQRFYNRELSALLVVLVAGLSGVVLFSLGNWFGGWLSELRRVRRAVYRALLVLASLLALTVLVALGVHNRSGFAQLDEWLYFSLLGGVIGALLVYWVMGRGFVRRGGAASRLAPESISEEKAPQGQRDVLVAPPGLRVRLRVSLVLLSLLLGFLSGLVDWPIVPRVAQYGSVSRYLVLGLRALSDIDGDGYSSFWGGGDCAPWNAEVNPSAVEIPDDGLDNNCLGGDASGAEKIVPPAWFPPPEQLAEDLNLVLISVETLRSDVVSFSGRQKIGLAFPTTPNLDEYAKESFVFENFFATTPWTRLSIPAILSSRAPSRMLWKPQPAARAMRALSEQTPWVPEILQSHGYRTIAILNSFRAFTRAESAGFNRGFDVYDTSTKLSYTGGTMRGHIGHLQAKLAVRQLEQHQDKRFFLWIHLMEPHYTYERSKRAPNFGAGEKERYASEVWEADAVIGELLEALERLDLTDSTLVTVVGDHGEEFEEHGQRWHGSNLMQPQLHTAALMRVPGLGGRHIPEATSHEDLAPTWLNLLGLKDELSQLRGRNLTPLLSGERLSRDYFFLERFEVYDGSQYMAAIVNYPFKLIYTEEGRRYQYFNLEADPGERAPLPRTGDVYDTLEGLLVQHADGALR